MILRNFIVALIWAGLVCMAPLAAAAVQTAAGETETVEPAAQPEAAESVDTETASPSNADRIGRSPDQLPDPVRETWQSLVNAARSGNIHALTPLIAAQPKPPTFTFGDIEDPIAHLKSLSGDPEGREILAILLEVLEIGFVRVEAGTENEMYLWPYFADVPLERLTPEQVVEMFTILTAGDYQDMLSYGAYIFFRVGISPDGTWHFFVAGD